MESTAAADDGVRLWADRTGRGEPLVCCHGGPGLWDTFGGVADLLAADLAVYRWDQRGCGRSQRTGPYSTARTLADLDAVRRHFGLERMALLGHSWGARLALQYAIEHPERVSALVYVSGTGIDQDAAWHAAYARARDERLGPHLERWRALKHKDRTGAEDREFSVLQWSADFADPARAMEHAERMAEPWFGVNFACNAALIAEDRTLWGTPELRAACAELDVPTLIIDGAEDIRPRWSVDSLEHALPRVTRITLKSAAHLPWTETPEAFRTTITEFLTNHP
ncbi:proline iminopeptidase [Murinocardiopsis flavida]|uniref:Proline iminopeptidase n=1 Tax=Murinocardiopsis flavida TaxID=645275 RepID=A0A2P8D526_9ACTN|nr:alpha/beta hydrolase [Murinocardiopsis flavida]PSK92311.1 proline iminopeptidase [Murinocardiopsis flavida]